MSQRSDLWQITAPHFVAGVYLREGTVTCCAPIVRYMMGWSADNVRNYCGRKDWRIAYVRESRA